MITVHFNMMGGGGSLRVQFAVLHTVAPLQRAQGHRQLIVPGDRAADVFFKVLEESVPPHLGEGVALRPAFQRLKHKQHFFTSLYRNTTWLSSASFTCWLAIVWYHQKRRVVI